MDSLRGNFSGLGVDDDREYDLAEEEAVHEVPPSPVGQDERRMQVRAYNHWAGLLDASNFPSIEDLDPESLPDFGPYSVLLDFTAGIENPAIQYLGAKLAEECAGDMEIRHLADVPSRSLLSRITDHYMQILGNQAPIGFEAEFVNQRSATILYRGILLPFSSNGDTIDFIYGVINWKEMADQQTTDALLLEIDQALEAQPTTALPELDLADLDTTELELTELAAVDEPVDEASRPDWADGPADENVLDLVSPFDPVEGPVDWPAPAFGAEEAPLPGGPYLEADETAPAGEMAFEAPGEVPFPAAEVSPPTDMTFDEDEDCGISIKEPDPEDMGLADWLASARELAQAAKGSEDRSRHALYAAIGRAYDFSMAAAEEPEDFLELVSDSGLTMQDRAPMTPVVKLVFGAEYDKTRLTEYASALSHAHRLSLERGTLAQFLISAPGGLKGVVNAERRLKRDESGKPQDARETPREALARKLRKLDHLPLDEVSNEGNEFSLLVVRRLPDGEVVLLGEVSDDVALLERAARRLLG